jgi:hypothetical protein
VLRCSLVVMGEGVFVRDCRTVGVTSNMSMVEYSVSGEKKGRKNSWRERKVGQK